MGDEAQTPETYIVRAQSITKIGSLREQESGLNSCLDPCLVVPVEESS